MSDPVVVWGATGQAKVVRPMIQAAGYSLDLLVDRDPDTVAPFDVPLVEPEAAWATVGAGWRYVVAIGGTRGCDRVAVASELERHAVAPLTLTHERAWVARSATVGRGVQICALAGVSEEATVGDHTIVNTGAIIDHECHIGVGVHVMPGATLAGMVTVGDFATVGSNATILPRVTIGEGAIIGAGAVVVRDVVAGTTVKGVPAR